MKELRGILPAPITPFDSDGSLRLDLFEGQIRYLLDAGVHGIFAGGTTAEGPSLSSSERVSIFKVVKDSTTNSHLRCAAIIRPDTISVLREIDVIAVMEPDYISAVSPFFTAATQSDIVGHFLRIADHSPCPILLYNIPKNTHNPMTLETILELAQHPNICGVKDSSGDFKQFQRGVLGPKLDEFTWIQGDDMLDYPALQLGVRCIVTGLANVWASPYVAMFDAAEAGTPDSMVAEQRRINTLACIIPAAGGNVIAAIKSAAELQGRGTQHMRIPSMKLSEDQRRGVAEVLRKVGLV